jgi:hypothetical protein
MKKLYQKIRIENFYTIQKELIDLIPIEKLNLTGSEVESWMIDKSILLSSCPSLNDFLAPRLKKNISQVKFYMSPAGAGTKYHTDGTHLRQPFGLSFPLQNTKNTYLNWYKEDQDNFRVRRLSTEPLYDAFLHAIKEIYTPIDPEKLELVGSHEILEPAFTRSDLMHNVVNNSGSLRIIVVIRWPQIYTEIEDVFDTTGILYE